MLHAETVALARESKPKCPCGSGKPYEDCCGPLLAGAPAPDAMDDISRTLVGAEYLDPNLRKTSSQILSKAKKYFYGNDGEALPNEVQYRNRLDNAENKIKRLDKIEKANHDK